MFSILLQLIILSIHDKNVYIDNQAYYTPLSYSILSGPFTIT